MSNKPTIKKVETKKQIREFINFPNELYKNNPCYVPKLYSSEKEIFKPDYMYNSTCDCVFFNAYVNGKMAGRIQGILQKTSNEIRSEKRVRFTRFDTINNIKVCQALLNAVESWAKSLNMDTVFGPLGYSDIEPEGVLVEGFDQISTFFETYNADYYAPLLEKCGYVKEVDWLEHQVSAPSDKQYNINTVLNYLKKQSKMKILEESTEKEMLKKYGKVFFEIIDESYEDLYQTVPLPPIVISETLKSVEQIINKRYFGIIADEHENIIAIGIAFPSIVKAVQKSKGHLYPSTIVKIKKAVNNPKGLELGLIGVKNEYRNSEACALMLLNLVKRMQEDGIPFAETNLNLETNKEILSQWENFDTKQHKRRRCYIKKI